MSATMDLFDLILVSAAVIFHLSIVGVYIAQKKGRDKLVRTTEQLPCYLAYRWL